MPPLAAACPPDAIILDQAFDSTRSGAKGLREVASAPGQTQAFCVTLATPATQLRIWQEDRAPQPGCGPFTLTVTPPAPAPVMRQTQRFRTSYQFASFRRQPAPAGTYGVQVTAPVGCPAATYLVAWEAAGQLPNQPPQARLQAPANAAAGSLVTLDGQGSRDPEGQPLTYAWTQTAGPAVTLSGATSAQATFTAPSVTVNTPLSFRLTVSDGTAQNTATATLTVTPLAPTLTATLAATPMSGPAPLTATLTATVGGAATGPVTVRFDYTSDGTWDATDTSAPYTASYTYAAQGNPTATAEVSRAGLINIATTTLRVTAPAPVTCPAGTLSLNVGPPPQAAAFLGGRVDTLNVGQTKQYCITTSAPVGTLSVIADGWSTTAQCFQHRLTHLPDPRTQPTAITQTGYNNRLDVWSQSGAPLPAGAYVFEVTGVSSACQSGSTGTVQIVWTTSAPITTPLPPSPDAQFQHDCANDWHKDTGGFWDADGQGTACRCVRYNSAAYSSEQTRAACQPQFGYITQPPIPTSRPYRIEEGPFAPKPSPNAQNFLVDFFSTYPAKSLQEILAHPYEGGSRATSIPADVVARACHDGFLPPLRSSGFGYWLEEQRGGGYNGITIEFTPAGQQYRSFCVEVVNPGVQYLHTTPKDLSVQCGDPHFRHIVYKLADPRINQVVIPIHTGLRLGHLDGLPLGIYVWDMAPTTSAFYNQSNPGAWQCTGIQSLGMTLEYWGG